MNIEIKIDSSCSEPKIIVITDKVTDEINYIIDKLSDKKPQILTGYKDEVIEVLNQAELIRVYSSSGKVFAVTDKGEYTLRLRLYEAEKRLNSNAFVRISNSEIVNLNKVKSFDMSFVGTICIKLSNGTSTYASRRYVSKIKDFLGV